MITISQTFDTESEARMAMMGAGALSILREFYEELRRRIKYNDESMSSEVLAAYEALRNELLDECQDSGITLW